MRAGAAKHVGVKVVPTEIAHQKRSHAAFAGRSKLPLFEGAGRCEGMRHSDCVCDGRTGGPGDRGCWQGGVGGAMLLSLIAKSPNLDAASGGANRACEPALTAVLEGNWMPRAGLGGRGRRGWSAGYRPGVLGDEVLFEKGVGNERDVTDQRVARRRRETLAAIHHLPKPM